MSTNVKSQDRDVQPSRPRRDRGVPFFQTLDIGRDRDVPKNISRPSRNWNIQDRDYIPATSVLPFPFFYPALPPSRDSCCPQFPSRKEYVGAIRASSRGLGQNPSHQSTRSPRLHHFCLKNCTPLNENAFKRVITESLPVSG